jgi:hypothetical protein
MVGGVAPPGNVPDDGAGGPTLAFADNGDGTITDLNTGLMWEAKVDDGGLHDKDNTYKWDFGNPTIWDWISQVNAEGGDGIAGNDDWRVANIKELISIADYEKRDPAVAGAFNSSCVEGCSVGSCSCTAANEGVWSSTTRNTGSPPETHAWVFHNPTAAVTSFSKGSGFGVRAVRGGVP